MTDTVFFNPPLEGSAVNQTVEGLSLADPYFAEQYAARFNKIPPPTDDDAPPDDFYEAYPIVLTPIPLTPDKLRTVDSIDMACEFLASVSFGQADELDMPAPVRGAIEQLVRWNKQRKAAA